MVLDRFLSQYGNGDPTHLNQTEATLKGEFEEERMNWTKEMQELKRQVARLAE